MNKPDLIRNVVGLQEEINRLIMEYDIQEWLTLALSISQLKSMIYIYSRETVSYKELAGALNVTPSVVTGIVDRLIEHGLVKRKRSSTSTDRRLQWLVISEKGKTLLENIKLQANQNISNILETMQEDDLEALLKGFTALVKASEPFLKKKLI